MIIYQDESGDLGKQKLLSRLVRNIYAKYRLNLKIEKKGSSFTGPHAAM